MKSTSALAGMICKIEPFLSPLHLYCFFHPWNFFNAVNNIPRPAMGPNLYGPSLLETRRKTGLYKTKDQSENTIVLVLIPPKLIRLAQTGPTSLHFSKLMAWDPALFVHKSLGQPKHFFLVRRQEFQEFI